MTTTSNQPTVVAPHDDTTAYWNKSEVLARGWTTAGITRFLGQPDQERRNPRRRRGPKIQLFARDRVTAAETTTAWKQWKQQSQQRSERALARAQQSRRQTLDAAQSALTTLVLAPEFCGLSYDQVKSRASTSFLAIEKRRADRSPGRYTAEQITARRTDKFFHRIMVNWLRHEGTVYDASLDDYFRRVGADIAKDMVRERAYQLIAAEYPVLADECERQLAHRRAGTLRRKGVDVSAR